MNDAKVEEWFAIADLSKGTQEVYQSYMKQFCECIGKTPSQLIDEAIQETKQGLLLSERKTTTYIAKFIKCLKDQGYSPKYQGGAIACVKSFYKHHDIQLSNKIGKAKPKPLKENQNFLTKEDIKNLLTNAKNLRDKAIILCMATSGLARQEILNLKVKDIKFDNDNIGVISIRRQKTETDFITFISPEAVKALQDYWDERKRITKVDLKEKDHVFVDYNQHERINEVTFGRIFRALAEELGYTNGEYQIKSKPHALRKYFASTLENAGMPKNKIDFMLGHVVNGVDQAYFKVDTDKLKELYKQYLPYLTFEKTIEIRSLNTDDAKRLAELEKENQSLKDLLKKQASDSDSLREQLKKQQDENDFIMRALKAKGIL